SLPIGASGSGRSRVRGGSARHRIFAAHAAAGRIVERPGLHGSRFSTGVLSALSRLLRLLSAVGTRRLSQPVAGRNPALNGLGIVAALAAEARPLGTGSKGADGAVTLGDGTLLVVSGVGVSEAAAGARRLAAPGRRRRAPPASPPLVPGLSSAGVSPGGWTRGSRPGRWCCRAKSFRRTTSR